jgi:hypothetical protein
VPGALQMRRFTVVVLALATLCARSPLLAQQTARVTADLPATMSRFLDVLDRHRLGAATRAFFPTSGDWRYTRTLHMPNGRDRVERWVFPAGETAALFDYNQREEVDPLLESLRINQEGQKIGLLLDQILQRPGEWRQVGRTRFVPPCASASSATYVQWRREGKRWVIDAFADEWFQGKLPTWFHGEGARDCPRAGSGSGGSAR